MSTISLAESSRQVEELVRVAEAARTGPVDDAVAGWRRFLGHPCAHHQVIDHEIIDEIHQLLRAAGRYGEAIDAKREAIAAGLPVSARSGGRHRRVPSRRGPACGGGAAVRRPAKA